MKLTKPLVYSSLTLSLFTACNSNSEEKINIIYIMTDDHSFQTISAYDRRYIETPSIDRLAAEGVRFTNSFVTNSISGPSRACLLTGKLSHKNGFKTNEDEFDGSQQTFPKLLQQAGYQTAMIGKWHLHSEPTGFDYWNILPGQGQYYNPDFIEMGKTKHLDGYVTNITTDIAIDWLENKRDKDKAFCMLLHHKAPHRTWMPDTAHLDMFKDRVFPVPTTFFDTYEGRKAAAEQHISIRTEDMDLVYDLKMTDTEIESERSWLGKAAAGLLGRMNAEQRKRWDEHYRPIIEAYKKEKPEGDSLAVWKFQRYMQDYLACIYSVDLNIGRVIDYLEEKGLLENTIIVYTSDQGFYMGEHGWFDKRFMYEESLRTPLLIRLPKGFKIRGDISQMVQNIDHAAMFLDLAGVSVPEDIQGESYLPLLKGETPVDWRKSIYYHYYEYPNEHMVKKHYGVRDSSYKLIHFYDNINEWEFYDLKNDPDEMNNVIGKPEYANEISRMKEELKRLQHRYDDTEL